MQRWIAWGAVIALLGFGCGDDDGDDTTTPTMDMGTPAPDMDTTTPDMDTTTPDMNVVTGSDYERTQEALEDLIGEVCACDTNGFTDAAECVAFQVNPAEVQACEGAAVDAAGVAVQTDDGRALTCRFLQTSGGPPLVLAVGDRVVVATAAEGGYVLGRLGPSPKPEAGRVVEIVVPEGVETGRISGRRITIAADESVATHTLWGHIGDAGDQDRFSFDAEAGDRLTVSFVRTAHGESTAVQVQLVNPVATASQCATTPPGDDDDSAGDDDDSGSGGGDSLPACCSTSSCGSVTPAPIAWDGSEDPVLSLQELGAGTWNLSVSDVDPTAWGGGNYYELTLSLLRQ